ncbi:MAG: cytidine deaminase [Candidatus Dependentiae bacterium]|nr:cytidine deaminase [Candidatus Dependentiae bacterium]
MNNQSISNIDLSPLIEHATSMQANAIATYSNFKVGACLRTQDGALIGGFNIESASYGLTMCAERVAIFSALAQGHKNFTHLILVTNIGVFPCGACRQMIYEFCKEAVIVVAKLDDIIMKTTIQELMPHVFCNDDLEMSKKG